MKIRCRIHVKSGSKKVRKNTKNPSFSEEVEPRKSCSRLGAVHILQKRADRKKGPKITQNRCQNQSRIHPKIDEKSRSGKGHEKSPPGRQNGGQRSPTGAPRVPKATPVEAKNSGCARSIPCPRAPPGPPKGTPRHPQGVPKGAPGPLFGWI